MTRTLFISHATKEDAAANRVADALEKAGFSTWVDHRKGIEPGDSDWDAALRNGITGSDAGVFIMSPLSLASAICKAEMMLTQELKKPFYVLKLETCKPEDVWLFIKMAQYADLAKDFDKGMQSIVDVLNGKTPADPTTAPTAILRPLTGGEVMRKNLPYLNVMPLSGRVDDFNKIKDMLGAYVTQVIAVGGTGKSRLSAELALSYPSGAVWHRCSSVSAAYELVDLLRKHVGVEDTTKEDVVLELVAKNPPLIVIDNAEDVPEKSETRKAYVALLDKCRDHQIPMLLTSRSVWHELKPEMYYRLPPLDSQNSTHIAQGFAVAVNVDLSESQAVELAEASRYHPRLIEFAVRQLHERSFAKVLKQLQELKGDDLQELLEDMVHKTIRQIVEQTKYGTDAEQLLKRLVVFWESFDEAALIALAPEDMDEDTRDEALVTLQRWQFVRRDGDRYRLEKLLIGAIKADEESRAKHFDYFEGLHGDYDTNQEFERFNRITPDFPNVLAALEWGWTHKAKQTCDWLHTLNFYMQFTETVEQRILLNRQAQSVAQTIDYQLGLANARMGEANALLRNAELGLALEAYRAAAQSYSPFESGMADARLGEANVLRMTDKLGLALEVYREAAQLCENLGYWKGLANTRIGEANALLRNAEWELALEVYRAAAQLCEEIGHRQGLANAKIGAADVLLMNDEVEQALEAYQVAAQAYDVIGDWQGLANARKGEADALLMSNEVGLARIVYQYVLTLYTQLKAKVGQMNTLRKLALLEAGETNKSQAVDHYRQCLAIADSLPDFRNHSVTQQIRRELAALENS